MRVDKEVEFQYYSNRIRVYDGKNFVYEDVNVLTHKFKMSVLSSSLILWKDRFLFFFNTLCVYDRSKNENTSLMLKDKGLVLMPSWRAKTAKRSYIELKLHWKTILGIKFSKRFYVSQYEIYESVVEVVIDSYYIHVSVFSKVFIALFDTTTYYCRIEYRTFRFLVDYKYKSEIKVYSRVNKAFEFLFIKSVSDLDLLFPNHIIDTGFSSLERFYLFSYYNIFSFKSLKVVIKWRLMIRGKAYLKGLYGINKLTKFTYKGKIGLREGVKFCFNKFYYLKGHLSRCDVRPVFRESGYHSCFSFSFSYARNPYTKIISFNTNSRMGKFCKTFKPEKAIQNSSVFKTDKYWKRGERPSYKDFFKEDRSGKGVKEFKE